MKWDKSVQPGRFEFHHNQTCDLDFHYTSVSYRSCRAYWCSTHGQWTYEYPVKMVSYWADGTTTERTI
jgi:hypothetical protein